MRILKTQKIQLLTRFAVAAMVAFGPIASLDAEEELSAEQKTLIAEEVEILDATLAEMKALAPKLRVSLRSVPKQSGLNARVGHKVERNLSISQKDMERLIAMHRRGAVSQMRAHFLVDDLRRKTEGLKASLTYIEDHLQEQAGEESGLIQLLGRYTILLDSSLTMLQEKGF